MPTHFLGGVSNVGPTNPLFEFGMLDPTKWHVFWDDFNHEPWGASPAEWVITATSVGTGTSAITTPDTSGGMALITTAQNENDGLYAQTVGEIFLLASGKKAFLKSRFKVSDATQSDFIVGLHSTDTTPQDATMRFFFESVDGSAAMYFNNDNNTTDSDSGTVTTLANDTFVSVAAYWDGNGNIKLYENDVHKTTMTGITIPGAEMAVGFGYLTGAAGEDTCNVDYIFVANER
jgi:hypothetical protein